MRTILTTLILTAGVAALVGMTGCGDEQAPTDDGQAAAAEFVNARCPIMGNPINPENVTDDLTREFRGQKVAFCCAACPSQWDELSGEEKAEKLQDVLAEGEHIHESGDMHDHEE